MIADIVTIILYAFNLLGFCLLLHSVEEITCFLKRSTLKRLLLYGLVLMISALIMKRLGIYILLALIVEYVFFLVWSRGRRDLSWARILKGIICLLLMVLAQIGTVTVYAYRTAHRYGEVVQMNEELRLFCWLAMAMMPLISGLLLDFRKVRKGFLRTISLMLLIGTVEDMLALYLCMAAMDEAWYMSMVSLLLANLWIKYVIFAVLQLKASEQPVRGRHTELQANAYEYYLHMEEEHIQIRKMYHEMKNWMMIVNEQGSNASGAGEHRKIAADSLDDIKRFYHTGQPSLNMLLYEGRTRAHEKGIEFDAVVSEGCLAFMAEEDIKVLFGNAIINAIEACEKIEEGSKKIQIRAGVAANDTLICIKNTVAENRKRGTLRTAKKNKMQHGIGMSNIQECVEKYQGYLSITEENGTFQLAILFYRE